MKVAIGVGIAAGIVAIIIVTTCFGWFGTPSLTTLPRVTYKVTGTATEVHVTLINRTGGTEQYSPIYLPWERSYSSFSDNFVYISAQNQGESGSVTVSIYVNDVLFKTSTSSGAYVIASASGSIG